MTDRGLVTVLVNLHGVFGLRRDAIPHARRALLLLLPLGHHHAPSGLSRAYRRTLGRTARRLGRDLAKAATSVTGSQPRRTTPAAGSGGAPRNRHTLPWLSSLSWSGSSHGPTQGGQAPAGHVVAPKALRRAERLVEEIFSALDEQTFTVPRKEPSASLVVPSLAGSLTAVLDQRAKAAGRAGRELLEAPRRLRGPHPASRGLGSSIRGVGVV